jgi:hypothetical protein
MKSNDKSDKIESLQRIGTPTSDVLSFDLANNYGKAVEIVTNLIKSKKLGSINTPEAAIALYIKTKELGLPFITGIDHMFDVNGKTALDVHSMRALVLKAGTIHWELVHDFVPLYKYIDSTKQTVAIGTDESCLPYGYELLKGNTEDEKKEDFKRLTSIGATAVFKSVDKVPITANQSLFNYIMKYKFTRIIKYGNTTKELVEYGEFSMLDAINAGLHLKKDNTINISSPWLVYTRTMLEHRSWTFGARKIADDILFGLLEHTEALDLAKQSYTIVDGKAEVVE